MEITHTQYKHCDVIKVTGRIDSSSAPHLAQAFNSILEDDRYHLVLDMSNVDFISSAGLRVLISTQKTCRRYNRGELVLADVPTNIMAALDLAGFNILFKIYNDVVEAVGNF